MQEENKNSILSLMISHHALLETLFFVLKDSLRADKERARETIASFRFEYEKHMFAEENIIFAFLRWNHPKLFETTIHLTDEHGNIRKLIDKIETEVPPEATPDVIALQSLLTGHRKDEEENLYPIVDKELSDFQKQEIILRINEIAPHNYTRKEN